MGESHYVKGVFVVLESSVCAFGMFTNPPYLIIWGLQVFNTALDRKCLDMWNINGQHEQICLLALKCITKT